MGKNTFILTIKLVCIITMFMGLLLQCTYNPVKRIDKEAIKLGFKREVIVGEGFRHVIFFHNMQTTEKCLHVYLEGDGSPWETSTIIASDPTPHYPLMLDLMGLDFGPSVYIGRPCYYGMATDSLCEPGLWTAARYSQQIISSMVTVLNKILIDAAFEHVVLIGHSGGGTVAMLMASEVLQTKGIVTIAGNLDPELWANIHNYYPLDLSLNPSRRHSLSQDIYQLHLIGEDDKNVLPEMLRLAAGHQVNPEVKIIQNFNHKCCWKDIWTEILNSISCK